MQDPKHIKHAQARPSTPKHAQARPSTPKQLLGTYENLLNLKEHEIFDLKKKSYKRRKEEQSSL